MGVGGPPGLRFSWLPQFPPAPSGRWRGRVVAEGLRASGGRSRAWSALRWVGEGACRWAGARIDSSHDPPPALSLSPSPGGPCGPSHQVREVRRYKKASPPPVSPATLMLRVRGKAKQKQVFFFWGVRGRSEKCV